MRGHPIQQTFEQLGARGQIGLMPFIPAGYPDLATTAAALPALDGGGANVIEIGFPFSDPIADGPTSRKRSPSRLANKLKLGEIFQTIAAAGRRSRFRSSRWSATASSIRYGVDALRGDGQRLPDSMA